MNKPALKILRELAKQFKRQKYAGVPFQFIPDSSYGDSTANKLTKCIIDFLTFSGHQSERISNQGRVIDGRKKYVDVLGHTREIGTITRIKSAGTNGTADLHATILGRSVKIEIKVGRDIQSEAQRRYQQSIEASGGVYVMAISFQQFYDWYQQFIQ